MGYSVRLRRETGTQMTVSHNAAISHLQCTELVYRIAYRLGRHTYYLHVCFFVRFVPEWQAHLFHSARMDWSGSPLRPPPKNA